MDFDDTPEEAAFRAEVRDFLDTHAELRDESGELDGYYGRVASAEAEAEHVAQCKAWQRTKFDAGWGGITWPVASGGRGLSGVHQGIFSREEARYRVPTGVFAQSIGMAGPTIIAHGTEAQRERFLRPMLTGEEVWCQLFSEPGAGSDLAGLRTSAVRDGDEFVVNGQKVWTSGAQYSDWGMLLVRTDVDAPKHRGITYLLVDMTAAGIEIRPIVQINGAAHFNEVFLSDVRVPVEHVVGEVNAGWGPILTTLTNERTLIGGGQSPVGIREMIALARAMGVADDPVVRQELARHHSYFETVRFMGYRVQTAASKGIAPGPESSVMKMATSRRLAHAGDLTMAIQGAAGMLYGDDAPSGGYWQSTALLGQWASRIGGGTDQVQRNIVGENVLGLPSEPRVDKGVPFREIPS